MLWPSQAYRQRQSPPTRSVRAPARRNGLVLTAPNPMEPSHEMESLKP
jgi:hypothetical protein